MTPKEIHLICTPEEWNVLRLIIDFHVTADEPDEYYPQAPFQSLYDKVQAIQQRLDFAKDL